MNATGREVLDAHLAPIASILVHEFTHVTNSPAAAVVCAETNPDGSEKSACACYHAEAYANQLKFMLLLKVQACIDTDAGSEKTFAMLTYTQFWGSYHHDWLDKRANGQAGKDSGEHEIEPQGEGPAVEGGEGLPPSSEGTECDDVVEFFPGVSEGDDGSITGQVDPDLDGDGNPCTSPAPEGEQGGESGEGEGEGDEGSGAGGGQ